jgi:hypothetical protein
VHRHATRALHARFDDERGYAFVVDGKEISKRTERRRLAAIGRAGQYVRATHHGRVGVAEQRDIGHRERTDGFTVIAAGETHEFILAGTAAVAPEVERHLERDLGGGCTVRSVERMTELTAGQRRQALRERDHRLMGEAGKHHVIQRIELIAQRRDDVRMTVTEQIGPPRADAVEVAPAVRRMQPRPARPRNGEQRQRLVGMPLHLGAWMPDGGETAGNER